MNESDWLSVGVTLDKGLGGQDRVVVRNALAEAEIYLHGATITHFQPAGQKPVLMVSRDAIFDGKKAIRGGVPICWPWFGPHPTDPKQAQHGTVRTQPWSLVDAVRLADGATRVSFAIETPIAAVRYDVTVGRSLVASLTTTNRSPAPLTITEALHAYFVVGDVRQVSVEGLAATDYIDRVIPGRGKQGDSPIRFTGEYDRTFLNTGAPVTVTDPVLNRRLVIAKQGSQSTVVWNPWADKARAMADLADDQWPQFVCVETANASDNAVTIAPGASRAIQMDVSVMT